MLQLVQYGLRRIRVHTTAGTVLTQAYYGTSTAGTVLWDIAQLARCWSVLVMYLKF